MRGVEAVTSLLVQKEKRKKKVVPELLCPSIDIFIFHFVISDISLYLQFTFDLRKHY